MERHRRRPNARHAALAARRPFQAGGPHRRPPCRRICTGGRQAEAPQGRPVESRGMPRRSRGGGNRQSNWKDPRFTNPIASRLLTCRNMTLSQFAAELNTVPTPGPEAPSSTPPASTADSTSPSTSARPPRVGEPERGTRCIAHRTHRRDFHLRSRQQTTRIKARITPGSRRRPRHRSNNRPAHRQLKTTTESVARLSAHASAWGSHRCRNPLHLTIFDKI